MKENDIIALVVSLDTIEPPSGGNRQISRSLIMIFINGEYRGIMY